MLYHVNWLPCDRYFYISIDLFSDWRRAVAEYDPTITQATVDSLVEREGRRLLDVHGYDAPFEHDGEVRPLYEPRSSLHIKWGEWGPEHISVPGSACGLDICDSIGSPRGGRVLLPHNVDHMRQASLLLSLFTLFADAFVSNYKVKLYARSD